ncbi:hypothetical protein C8Q79DRAFT_543665 [Trametes meyenii]|nr:hypothetical protein C8Q79DRAFT_543665 [Trametes meyenii]
MPSFTFSSDVRDSTDGLLLVLRARHILVAGSPSDDTHIVKGRLPDGVDVILESDLVIALSGTVNRVPIDASDIQCSAIARHLLNYFHVNSAQLGLRPASKIFVDDTDGIAKLTLSPTRHLLRPRTAALRLSAIEILYVFKTPQPQGTSGAQPHAGLAVAADPFSPHAFLPLVAALDRTVERLVVTQLIRRYPLIFGPWRERFDAEVATSAKIARAVADIVSRSSHAEFSQRSRRLIKALRRNCAAIAKASDDALRGLLPNTRGDEVLLPSSSGSEECA